MYCTTVYIPYTDSLGNTVTLESVPTRIIASQDAAAGLIPLGIRPVGIYADSPVADAKARAELIAGAAGVKLGAIKSISEGGPAPMPMPMLRMAAEAAAGAVPVASGEVGTTAQVTIVWTLAP